MGTHLSTSASGWTKLIRIIAIFIFSFFDTWYSKLHLSIFYEYQQVFQHRICFSIQPQLQLVNLHRNRRYFVIKLHTWFCLSYFMKTNLNFIAFINILWVSTVFSTPYVSRYSRPITDEIVHVVPSRAGDSRKDLLHISDWF
jgi:hypothetical protein